ncbi:LOW QUALITY PROTEIN: hypothetical protein HID58_005209, partial [Brassica napus]
NPKPVINLRWRITQEFSSILPSIAVGQIVIEHFAYTNPLTVENFRALCTGEKGIGESDIPLHYKGSVEDSIRSIIHGIDPDHVWFGGYMTQGNGFGGEWIYGDEFPDEECMRKHDRIQVSSQWAIMLNNQTDLSSSPTRRRPRITTKNRRTLRSLSGWSEMNLFPSLPVSIVVCGQILFPIASCATEDGGDGDSIGKAKDCI